MRILYMCLQPRGEGGASHTHVGGLVAGLLERGHDVRVAESRRAGGLVGRGVAALWVQVRSLRALRRSDVVWLRMHPLGVVTAVLAPRRALVVEVNGVAEDFFVAHPSLARCKTLVRAALWVQVRRATLLLPVTSGLACELRRRCPGAYVHVVPNAVDPNKFRPDLARPVGLPPRYVLLFGALASWQGVDLALAATLENSWPEDVVLVIAGDGACRATVEAAQAATPWRVRYLGQVEASALPPYVTHATASIIPKRYHDEAAGQSPLKLYESLASGVPVIATRMTGLTDVAGLDGLLYEVDQDAGALARAVAEVAADESGASRRGLAGRDAVMAQHTWKHRAEAAMVAFGAAATARRSVVNGCK
jgi:glycosyltransferase involved in cell wall biosynthesis